MDNKATEQTAAKYPGQVVSALKAVRRTLKQAGWPQGKILGRYYVMGPAQKIQEGIAVKRIGVSRTVALTWWEAGSEHGRWTPGLAKAKVAEAVALLRSKGFPFDDRGWMDCEYDA